MITSDGGRPGPSRLFLWVLKALYPREFWTANGCEILRFLQLQRRETRFQGWSGGILYHLEVGKDAFLVALRLRMTGEESAPRGSDPKPDPGGGAKPSMIDILAQDLRLAVRSLQRRAGFAVVVVGTLGLGIGATTAIFTVVNGVLLAPLPFEEPGKLVIIHETAPELGSVLAVSYPNYLDWQGEASSFESMFAFRRSEMNLTGKVDPIRLSALAVSASMFDVLGVLPFVGRGFLANEDLSGGPRAVVLSFGLWESQFGADPGLLGQNLTLDGLSYTVVGVMPESFSFPTPGQGFDLYVPIGCSEESWLEDRGSRMGVAVIGRLGQGVVIERARADLDALGARLEAAYPDSNTGLRALIRPLRGYVVRTVDGLLWAILFCVVFVLLIACTNVANLLLADAASRRREIGVMAALGASRGRIVRFLLTESVFLWLIGAGVGVGLAGAGTGMLTRWLTGEVPRIENVELSAPVLIFALGVTLATGVIFAVLPAVLAARSDPQNSIMEGGRTETGSHGQRIRRRLVVAEITLAQALLVVACLALQSLFLLTRVDLGFETENVLTLRVSLPQSRYPEAGDQSRFYLGLRDQAAAMPGVVSASIVGPLPLGNATWRNGYSVEGEEAPTAWQRQLTDVFAISADYHETMRIPLLRGRLFEDSDGRDSVRVAIVDAAFADRHWPDTDPIGKRIAWGPPGPDADWFRVVGVVGSVKHQVPGSETAVQMYFPFEHDDGTRFLAVRTEIPSERLVEPLRKAVLDLDPLQPISAVRTMDDYFTDTFSSNRIMGLLLGAFAGLAVLLASVGIYGVVSRSVTERTREVGVRMALGASRARVLGSVVRQGLAWTMMGLIWGSTLALMVAAFLEAELYGVKPLEPLGLVSASACLALISVLASYFPARKASKVEPMGALRAD